jgi:cell division transport system permease protein
MSFILSVLTQTFRNFIRTWRSQALILITISLSVLIFSFFYLLYMNMMVAGKQLGDDLRLIVYLENEPSPPLQAEYRDKILKFDEVEKIVFVSRAEAFQRFKNQLGRDRDILTGMPGDFLSPSIEIYPLQTLDTLTRIKRFSEYLQTLPGVLRVQYGREWIDRFYTFARMLQVVIILSGVLLILTTTFMVANSIRLTLISRADELQLLRLLGATGTYIRMPYFFEGGIQGIFGAACGLGSLFILYNWIKLQFAGATFGGFALTFFPASLICVIIGLTTVLCAFGSLISTRKITLR